MIGSIFKYLATPGFFHKSPKDINPVRSAMELGQAQSAASSEMKKSIEAQKKEKFVSVDRAKAKALFADEIERLNVPESKVIARYHQHILYGVCFILLGFVTLSLPIVGLFVALDVSIPLLNIFLPVYTYPVLITMVPCSLVVGIVGIRHWYMAKMIALRQRFPFMQYIKSLHWLPNKTEVIE